MRKRGRCDICVQKKVNESTKLIGFSAVAITEVNAEIVSLM